MNVDPILMVGDLVSGPDGRKQGVPEMLARSSVQDTVEHGMYCPHHIEGSEA